MDFWTELIIICLAGGIIAIDTTASWQVMISQPLVACTILGSIFGNPQLGFLIGVLMELPWLVEIPAGGSHVSEGNVGSLVAAGIAIHLVNKQVNTENIIIVFSILWGLSVSWCGGKLVDSMRKSNVLFAYRADKAADNANLSQLSLLNMGGVGHAFSLGFFLVGISFAVGTLILTKLVSYIPQFFDHAFGFAKIGMLALGVSTMISMFITKRNYRYFLFGLVISLSICFIF